MANDERYSSLLRKKIEMDDEKLIGMVRANRPLYDADHCKYADTLYREKVWKEISAELKQPAIFCKKRWGNIRDNYKKSLKKSALKTEQGKTTVKKYKYSDLLEFLGFMFEERDLFNVSPIEIKTEIDTEDNTEESENYDFISQTEIKASDTDDEENCIQVQEYSRYKRGPKRKADTSGSKIAKASKYMVDEIATDYRAQERHPVDAFLSGIAPTLKSLSPYYLSLAKTQIYSIVQEYEMAMIMEQKNEKNPT